MASIPWDADQYCDRTPFAQTRKSPGITQPTRHLQATQKSITQSAGISGR